MSTSVIDTIFFVLFSLPVFFALAQASFVYHCFVYNVVFQDIEIFVGQLPKVLRVTARRFYVESTFENAKFNSGATAALIERIIWITVVFFSIAALLYSMIKHTHIKYTFIVLILILLTLFSWSFGRKFAQQHSNLPKKKKYNK